jgi:hypothetical protein
MIDAIWDFVVRWWRFNAGQCEINGPDDKPEC